MSIDEKMISVIVPVYNVEEYLDNCIKSISSQTYANIEILVIDDGSTDDSSLKCDQWAKKDKRIRVIHKLNGGLADARNVGIEMANGEYLLFVDSDDYIERNMCEIMIKAMESSQADIVISGFCWEYVSNTIVQSISLPHGSIVEREKILEKWVEKKSVDFVIAWNKLYRKELFFTSEQIRFPIGRVHEDEATCYKILYGARRVVFISNSLYHYVQRSGSITFDFNEKNIYDFFWAVRGYIRWADEYAPKMRKLMEYMTMYKIFVIIGRCSNNLDFLEKSCLYKDMIDYVKLEIKDFFHNPYATLKDKIKYICFKTNIYVYALRIYRYLVKKGACGR